MGESKRKRAAGLIRAGEKDDTAQAIDTLCGRMHVRWDAQAAATPHGQLVFFAEFLAATGVFDRWVNECPLQYASNNAPPKRDVLGTLMLGLLAGHRRYAHIIALRGKAVLLRTLIANIHAALRHVRQTAEQFASLDPWTTLVRYVSERIAPSIAPPKPDSALPATG
jgi:hypothetical protein